jgi:hypothetical protein
MDNRELEINEDVFEDIINNHFIDEYTGDCGAVALAFHDVFGHQLMSIEWEHSPAHIFLRDYDNIFYDGRGACTKEHLIKWFTYTDENGRVVPDIIETEYSLVQQELHICNEVYEEVKEIIGYRHGLHSVA